MKEKMLDILEKRPIPKAHSKEKHQIEISDAFRKILIWLLLINGVSCVCFTDYIHKMLPFELAVLMILMGCVDVFRGIQTAEYKRSDTKLTSNGILYVFLGIVILCSKDNAYSIICSLWGTLGLIKGSEELNKAICAVSNKEFSVTEWVSAIVEVVLGIMLFVDPIGSIHHHIMVLGLELIMIGWKQISAEDNFFKTHHLYWLLKLVTIIMICWVLKEYQMILFVALALILSELGIYSKKRKFSEIAKKDGVVKKYKSISMIVFYLAVVVIIVFPQIGVVNANGLLVFVGIIMIVSLVKSLEYYNKIEIEK